ncbi:hypothetical protein IFR05_003354 [Cadophora sp. M221]|nr:hypothetical protein IFR05_003354 [Cadophora sp. M221]
MSHEVPSSFGDAGDAEAQKYWQLVAQLPPTAIIDELVYTYVSEVHWIYGIIEPQYFQADLKEFRRFTSTQPGSASIDTIHTSIKCFPAVLFQILATSLQYLPRGSGIEKSLDTTPEKLSLRYSNAGVEIIQLLGNHNHCIAAVVHDLVRAAWLKNCGRGAQAWHALSDSVRKAQDLNLHQKSRLSENPSSEEFWNEQWKKRVWAMVLIWDSNMSILLGRPRLINSVDCNAEPPLDCDIPQDMESLHPSAAQSFTSDSNRPFSSFSPNLFMYSLSQKINDIRDSGADKRNLRDYAVVQRLHFEILSLLNTLPPVLQPGNADHSWDMQMPVIPRQREKIYYSVQSLILALHRPHVARYLESRQRAREAAFNVLDSQQRFLEIINKHHYAYFGNAFFSIDASIVLSTILSVYPCEDTSVLQRSMLAIQLAMGQLGLIEKQNELASPGLNIIRSCYQMIKDKYEERKFGPWPERSGQGHNTNNSTSSSGDLSTALSSQYVPEFEADTNWESVSSSFADSDQASQLGRNEFDTPFWIDYRQQVFTDSTFLLDGTMDGDMFGSF